MGDLLDFSVLETLGLLKVAIEQIEDWVIITDKKGVILYNNKQVEKLSGYKKKEIIGRKPSIWKSNIPSRATYQKLWSTILKGEAFYGVIPNRHKDGSIFYLANTISPVKSEDGDITYFVSTAKDITQNYKLKKQLYEFMHYDVLTQLPNRNLFIETMEDVIKSSGKQLVVLAINLKNISVINNTYGFILGDQVIKEVGKLIQKTVGKECTTARIESDMFAVLVSEVKRISAIIPLIKKIQEAVEQPVLIDNKELYVEIVTGVASYPEDAANGNELLNRAQMALLKLQKTNELNTYAFYTNKMNEEVERQLKRQRDIYKAYENDGFIPYFQPLVDLESQKIYGLEALMRRRGINGEIILPGEFIDVLEQIGLIDKVELQFIRKVCMQIRQWLDRGVQVVPVAINISPLQFRNKDLSKQIMSIIRQENIPSELITIEITESLFVEDIELAKSIVNELRAEGVLVAIDDFGTGYSSLSYLKEFSADHIKIDISFIRDITTSQSDKAIVKAIVFIARELGMETIAEGIEKNDQLRLVSELGCDIGQGMYWDFPLSAEEIMNKYLISK